RPGLPRSPTRRPSDLRGEGAPPKTEERPLAPRDPHAPPPSVAPEGGAGAAGDEPASDGGAPRERELPGAACAEACAGAFRTCRADRKSTRLNSSHVKI